MVTPSRESFLDLVSKSRETVEFYSNPNNPMLNNMYTLYLSNGDKLIYQLDPNNIPHLLGFKSLAGLLNEKIKSFDALKKIVLNGAARHSALKTLDELHWHYDSFMSPYYDTKVQYIREQLTAPYPNTILFVCKYREQVNYGSPSLNEIYRHCDYYIGRRGQNGDLLLLGFAKNKFGTYSPRTNRPIKKDDVEKTLQELLTNQTLCFVNALEIKNYYSGYDQTFFLYDQEKIETIQFLKKLASKYDGSVDTSQDHLSHLRKKTLSTVSMSVLKETLGTISSSVKKGEIIEVDDETLKECHDCKEEVQTLIEVSNDRLCVGSKNDKTKVAYSTAIKELEKLKVEFKKQQALAAKQEAKIQELTEQNRTIKSEKEELIQFKKKAEKKLKLVATENGDKKDE